MQRIVVHAGRRPVYRKLGLCLGVTALGVALVYVYGVVWAGWGLVLLAGGYAMLLLRSLGEEKERLVIDDAGIRDSLLPVGTIGWDEVQGASIQRIGSIPVVAIEVRDPERFIRRLPATRRFIARKALAANLPGLYLTLVGTEADPARIVEAIRQRVRPPGRGA